MAFEGAQMVPVYDMNKSDGYGFMGGGAGWMWVVMLFFLLAWGGGFGGFGGGANGAVNTLTNEFLYTNLNNTIDRGFNQLANQNFGIQKDICESTGALQMGLCQGFNQTNAAIAESRFAAQQCCCETNRNIDAVRAENYKNTCEITTLVITLSTTPTLTNLKRFCLVLAQSLPSGANTLPVQIQIGTTVYPVYTRTGYLW